MRSRMDFTDAASNGNTDFFNAFHTVVLKFNLLINRQTQQIIGHRLQGVPYKIQQDDMFRST